MINLIGHITSGLTIGSIFEAQVVLQNAAMGGALVIVEARVEPPLR